MIYNLSYFDYLNVPRLIEILYIRYNQTYHGVVRLLLELCWVLDVCVWLSIKIQIA